MCMTSQNQLVSWCGVVACGMLGDGVRIRLEAVKRSGVSDDVTSVLDSSELFNTRRTVIRALWCDSAVPTYLMAFIRHMLMSLGTALRDLLIRAISRSLRTEVLMCRPSWQPMFGGRPGYPDALI